MVVMRGEMEFHLFRGRSERGERKKGLIFLRGGGWESEGIALNCVGL